MKKVSCLILVLCYFITPVISAQSLRLPRDPEKLIDRVQRFWAAIASGQRFQALEFVLPEKKDLLVSGTPVPILGAKVLGLDLTTDPNRAAVRVSLETLSPQAGPGRTNWTITDPWVWSGNNWYVDLDSPPIFPSGQALKPLDLETTKKEIDKNFEILQNPLDLGKLIQGQHREIEVPVKYTGNVPVSVELGLPNSLVAIAQSEPLTSGSKQRVILLVGTEDWEGPFNLPLPLKIRYLDAVVERTILVKGDVFAPVTFRQEPPNGPIEAGREFSLFFRNNTNQEVGIPFIGVDGKFIFIKRPEKLLPNAEVEAVLKLYPDQIPDLLTLHLDSPLYGRDVYTYRFRNVR